MTVLTDDIIAPLKRQFYDLRLFNDLMACNVLTVGKQQQLLQVGEYIKVVPLVLSGSIGLPNQQQKPSHSHYRRRHNCLADTCRQSAKMDAAIPPLERVCDDPLRPTF